MDKLIDIITRQEDIMISLHADKLIIKLKWLAHALQFEGMSFDDGWTHYQYLVKLNTWGNL